jgi:hypothetical protein
MKRTIVILSSIFVFAVLALASVAQAQPNAEKLSKHDLQSLVASAKTPAEHNRLAQYYSAQAQDYLAQSKEHEQMAEQYKANALTSSSKYAAGTVNHCAYLAKSFKASAAQMQVLSQEHAAMAKEAGQK